MKIYPDFKNQNSRPQNSSYITDNRVPDWHLPSFSSSLFRSFSWRHFFHLLRFISLYIRKPSFGKTSYSTLNFCPFTDQSKRFARSSQCFAYWIGWRSEEKSIQGNQNGGKNHCCFFTCILVRSATFQPWFEMMYVKWPYRKNCRSLIPAFDL